MDCINLKEGFGSQYKVEYEESYFAERSKRTIEDPWLMIILCENGHICPWGGDLLAACTHKRGSVAKRLIDLDCTSMAQDGDDGINVTFHVDAFDQVAAVMKPRRKRQGRPTDEKRRELADRGRAALKKHREATSQARNRALESRSGGVAV